MLFRILIISLSLSLFSCSSWVYRIDIPQGNYLEQKDIDKLQVEMTKEQVRKVLKYGIKKGYKSTSELTDEEVDKVLLT